MMAYSLLTVTCYMGAAASIVAKVNDMLCVFMQFFLTCIRKDFQIL
jgi:hypothetical protein